MKKYVLLCYVVLFLLSSYGTFARLNNVVFWDDEAFVGLIAKNYLETGQFTGWSGRNLYGYANGTVLDANLRPINPPLDIWLMASSFRLFGVSEWAGRLPFAIAGLLGLALFGIILRREWKDQTAAQLYAFGSLALSVVFMLNISTGRYYALTLLFSLACYYAYQETLISKNRRSFLLLALSATALFYAHFLICVLFLVALATMHLAYRKGQWTAAQWRQCLVAFLLFLALTVPYAVAFRIWHRPDMAASTVPWLLARVYVLNINIAGWFNGGNLALVVLILSAAFIMVKPLRARHPELRVPILSWLLLVTVYTVLQTILSPMPVFGPLGMAEIRYYLPILPFCAGLTGLCLGAIHRSSPKIAFVLFLCLLCFNLSSATALRLTLPQYIREIHAPYPTSGSETMKFLRDNAKQDDVVRIVRQHHNFPVMFYMDDKLRFGALLDETTPIAPEKVRQMGEFLRVEKTFPQWLIFFGKGDSSQVWLDYLSRPTLQNGQWVASEYRLYRVLDVFFDQTQRPELPWHSFGPHTEFDRSREAVYIYRRSAPEKVSPPKAGQTWVVPQVRE